MEKLSENVFVETRIRGCNPGFVVTSEGVVVIDTPQLPTKALAMYEEARAYGPIRYLINTEHHVDHIFGNYYFDEVEHIVSHRATFDNFMTVYPQINPYEYAKEAIPTDDPEGAALFPDEKTYFSKPNKPDIILDGDSELKVGDHTFQILWTPGHTPGQLAVVVPEERIMFVGDTVFNGCQTWLYTSDLNAWFDSIDRLLEVDVDVIVPGHGPVCTKQELYVQRAFLLEWITQIAVAVGKGWTKEECLENLGFANRFPVDIGQEYMLDDVTKNNIASLYDQLTVKMSVENK
ncbi:MAG: MBL fold metallo-hydrolase [Sphaerochaetaceae bacterium]|nr:MBL fold metallo-hydrolase [Sphaerochaetaceae bacterium]